MHACLSILFVLLLTHTTFAATNEDAIAAYQQGKAAMERTAPQEAIPHFRKALEICTELSIDPCRSVNLSELGNAYAIQGRYSEALPAFQEMLAIRKRTGASAEMLIRGINDVGMTQYA
jgi:tetratricopeptide (TPR) repeat protein